MKKNSPLMMTHQGAVTTVVWILLISYLSPTQPLSSLEDLPLNLQISPHRRWFKRSPQMAAVNLTLSR
ncbi:MAG: hypothetical protein WBM86_08805 [Waterburya sp.]